VDSDVICDSGFLRKITEPLLDSREVVAAEGQVLPSENRESLLSDAPRNRGKTYPSGASAYRRDALARVGGFDESFPLPACEDVDLAANLLRLGEYIYVSEAVVYHPCRHVTWRSHWNWRRHWKYVMFLAERYGILAFPGKPAGSFPRLRLALAAVITLPAGRFMEGLKGARRNARESLLACLYACLDVFCGVIVLPEILFGRVPERKKYLVPPPKAAATAVETSSCLEGQERLA
jgi:GT2 family glycosyltransferase